MTNFQKKHLLKLLNQINFSQNANKLSQQACKYFKKYGKKTSTLFDNIYDTLCVALPINIKQHKDTNIKQNIFDITQMLKNY